MVFSKCVVIVDQDSDRRNRIYRQCRSLEWLVEPYDSVSELNHHSDRAAVALAADYSSNVVDVLSLLASRGAATPLIVYSESIDTFRVMTVAQLGASDYFAVPMEQQEFERRVLAAIEQDTPIARAQRAMRDAKARVQRLSKRERQVLDGISAGGSNKSIALDLGLSARTVEIHRHNMRQKLAVKTTSDAIRIAVASRLFETVASDG